MSSSEGAFPFESWLSEMAAAADRIKDLGRAILDEHGAASAQAAEIAQRWHLSERVGQERQALLNLLANMRRIVAEIDRCHRLISEGHASTEAVHQAMHRCCSAIEENLPGIEESFVVARQAALDLLQWTQRSARVEGSSLPDEYRASYARLISHAPSFRQLTAAFEDDLFRVNQEARLHPEAQRLISLVSRYRVVMESARGFVGSVVEPPLELVFRETRNFLEDFESLPSEQMTRMATELNDCCQLLLYDAAKFHSRVERVRPRLAKGVEASMVVLTVGGGYKVLLTVDEDPLFGQLVVTLFRVLPDSEHAGAKEDLERALYEHFKED